MSAVHTEIEVAVRRAVRSAVAEAVAREVSKLSVSADPWPGTGLTRATNDLVLALTAPLFKEEAR